MTYKPDLIKQAVFKLNSYYFKDKIVYPRVDNSYFGENYNFVAHPDLNEVDKFALPLNKETYPLNRDTVLLYLGHKGLVNSSTVIYANNFIESTFDSKLKPRNEKYVAKTIDSFLDFCQEHKISLKDYQKEKYSNFPHKSIYSIRLKPTIYTKNAANEKKLAKNNKQYISTKLSLNSKAFLDDDKYIVYHNDFFEALRQFKIRRKMLKLREKYLCE